MAYKDLHEEPFDDTTIAKLEIFEDYAKAWIPTFVMAGLPVISIFDFFAGTGYDKHGVAGSPIRILDKIKEHIGNIHQRKVKIRVYFNEFEPNKTEQRKFELLKAACDEYLENNKSVKAAIEIMYLNENFETLFSKYIDEIKQYPSLVYLDQNGIKFLSDKYLLELEKMKQTDFLYFVSASYFWRFGDTKEFKEHIDIDMEAAKRAPYEFIHRKIIEQLRLKLPKGTLLRLYPYSLRKGTNIHGIIFGATHPRAVDKFLSLAWKRNEINGEANFDIDGDSHREQLDLFFGQKVSKIQAFKDRVKEKILSREITNNFELLDFVFAEGHIGSHAADCVREMKKQNKLDYEGTSPLLTYEKVHKERRKIVYKLI